jgi:hypothetical protein
MKKSLYLFTASLLVMTSCSSDGNSSDPVASILPKTVSYSYPSYPPNNSSSTVVYNGNKIVSIKDVTFRTDYTYNGDVIVKTTSYDTESGKDVKVSEETYTYTNNKLATSSYARDFSTEYASGKNKVRSIFTYNTDGIITAESYYTYANEVIPESIEQVLTISNGNLVKRVISSSNDVRTDIYEYDTKNNPFKNVLGFNLLLNNDIRVDFLLGDDLMVSVNNVVKHTSTRIYGSDTYGPDVYNSVYIYDANGYPTKETVYQKEGTTVDEINEYTY